MNIRRSLGLAVAIIGIILMMAAASAPSPFYPAIQSRLGMTPGAVTAVFAIYTVVLLAALLTTGRLSEHIGRRPVLSIGFGILAVSVVLFAASDSLAALLWARSLQGLASGLLLSALSATIADLEAVRMPGSAAVWNSAAPLFGLAVGAFVAGEALSISEDAAGPVFGGLGAAFAVLALLVWIAPETSSLRPGWAASLRPVLAVPRHARREFWAAVPVLVAGWANGALFLSLGAQIVRSELGIRSHAWQGAVVGILSTAAAVGALVVIRLGAGHAPLVGMIAIVIGTGSSLIALAGHSAAVYLGAVAVAGLGYGIAFTGALRSVPAVVGVHERAGLFAAMYTVSYLAFGLPAVAAGFLIPVLTLGGTTQWYGAAVVLLAVTAVVLDVARRRVRPRRTSV
ncbi:MFS transporter [Microbacterium sp. MAHUQ-60]|uniref:MFS transporter n=1 Tax=unclassified Microbacterium TaxID=2609290 RepID=UPI0036078F6F